MRPGKWLEDRAKRVLGLLAFGDRVRPGCAHGPIAMVGDGVNDAPALAAAGLLSPVVAGAAMALSSIGVVGSALLLRRWKPGSVSRVGGSRRTP